MARCKVSYVDENECKHWVELEAFGLYEAIAKAIPKFREQDVEPEDHSRIRVEVVTVVHHEITYEQFQKFVNRPPRSPRDVILKDKLKALMST